MTRHGRLDRSIKLDPYAVAQPSPEILARRLPSWRKGDQGSGESCRTTALAGLKTATDIATNLRKAFSTHEVKNDEVPEKLTEVRHE
jgi:hypothetical protein